MNVRLTACADGPNMTDYSNAHCIYQTFLGEYFFSPPLSLSRAQLNHAPEALRLMPYVVTLSLTSFPNCRRLIRADETQALRNSCHTTELKLLPNAKCSVSLAQSRHLLPAWAFRQASENPSIACIFLKNIMINIKIQMLRYVLGIFSSLLTENSTISFAELLLKGVNLLGMIIGCWQTLIHMHCICIVLKPSSIKELSTSGN